MKPPRWMDVHTHTHTHTPFQLKLENVTLDHCFDIYYVSNDIFDVIFLMLYFSKCLESPRDLSF